MTKRQVSKRLSSDGYDEDEFAEYLGYDDDEAAEYLDDDDETPYEDDAMDIVSEEGQQGIETYGPRYAMYMETDGVRIALQTSGSASIAVKADGYEVLVDVGFDD